MSNDSETDDVHERPPTMGRIEEQVAHLRTAPRFIWAWFALWVVVGVYESIVETLLYGLLFVGLGVLFLWCQLYTLSEQEALVDEEGVVPLIWADWLYIGGLVVVSLYGFTVVQDSSALFLFLFTIPLIREKTPPLE